MTTATRPSTRPRRPVEAATRPPLRRCWPLAVAVAVAVVDQAALTLWAKPNLYDPGAGAGMPAWLSGPASSPTLGPVMSALAAAAVVAGWRTALRHLHAAWKLGAVLALSGWTANLTDRLGLSLLLAPGQPVGVPNSWQLPGGIGNPADAVTAAGLALLCGLGSVALWRRLRPSWRTVTAVAAAAVLSLGAATLDTAAAWISAVADGRVNPTVAQAEGLILGHRTGPAWGTPLRWEWLHGTSSTAPVPWAHLKPPPWSGRAYLRAVLPAAAGEMAAAQLHAINSLPPAAARAVAERLLARHENQWLLERMVEAGEAGPAPFVLTMARQAALSPGGEPIAATAAQDLVVRGGPGAGWILSSPDPQVRAAGRGLTGGRQAEADDPSPIIRTAVARLAGS